MEIKHLAFAAFLLVCMAVLHGAFVLAVIYTFRERIAAWLNAPRRGGHVTPVIQSVSPEVVRRSDGVMTIRIIGSGFNKDSRVLFGQDFMVARYEGSTLLSVPFDPREWVSRMVAVTVINSLGHTTARSNVFAFALEPAP